MPSDKDLESKCKHMCEGISECVHILSHDPSLALYRVQEHVTKSTPALVEKKWQMNEISSRLQGACFDTHNAMQAVKDMCGAGTSLERMRDHLKTTMYYRQQLDYERLRDDKRHKMLHSESNDSLTLELRKSKSMGLFRQKTVDGDMEPTALSTTSTPLSDAPLFPANDLTVTFEEDDRCSTSTSGADSVLPSDPELELEDDP